MREWASTSALKLAAFKRASEGGSSREIEAAVNLGIRKLEAKVRGSERRGENRPFAGGEGRLRLELISIEVGKCRGRSRPPKIPQPAAEAAASYFE